MVNSNWDFDPDQEDVSPDSEIVRRRDRGKMPVAREARARAACKSTWRSRVLSRKLGRRTDGIRNRRLKKLD
jgi:hypothetical protein